MGASLTRFLHVPLSFMVAPSNRSWAVVTLLVLLCCALNPAFAQQTDAPADTTAADTTAASDSTVTRPVGRDPTTAQPVRRITPRVDTVATDTVRSIRRLRRVDSDTSTADTTSGVENLPADFVQADSVRADSLTEDPVRADSARGDTTDSLRDTAARDRAASQRPAADTAEAPFVPAEFLSTSMGATVLDTLSALRREPDVASLLQHAQGAFFYDVGPEGFPHSVSLTGLPPQLASFWYDGRMYHDIVSGRPRYDLLPLAHLEPLRVGTDLGGQPNGVYAESLDDPGASPLTQIRYRRDSNGLSRGDVVHSQKREFGLFGEPGVLGAQFGFSGASASGEYGDATSFELYRGFFLRADYRRNGWGARISNEAIRHRVRAHEGVLPGLSAFESIYLRPVAQVRNARSKRQTIRNDLTASVRGPLLPGLPKTQASLTWTSNTFDYDTGSAAPDTTWFVKTNAVHGLLRQPLRVGPHRLTFDARGRIQQRARGNVLFSGGRRYEVHASVRDSVRLAGIDWTLDVGAHSTETRPLFPSASVEAASRLFGTRVFARLRSTGDRISWMEANGFDRYVRPVIDPPASTVVVAEAGLRRTAGAFDMSLRAYAHQMQNPVDLYALTRPNPASAGNVRTFAASDSVDARAATGAFRQAGVTADLGWRTRAKRGLYGRLTATAHEFLNETETALHARVARTLPQVHGRAVLGARFLLFQDLVFDAQIEGRGWTEMSSRLLHTPTGSLVVPPLEAPDEAFEAQQTPTPLFGPDGVLDVNIDIDLYGATLFFTFENVLGGTEADLGTFIVATYPLPDQQFRFGVFWPIFD